MKEIIIDGGSIYTKVELHDTLAEAFGFPAWYGRNLDALYDCLTDIREDTAIRIENAEALDERLPIYGRLFLRVVRRSCRDNSHLTCLAAAEDGDDDED